MIHDIWDSTRSTFKRLRFGPGLNIVLVRRTETASQGAKRNAAGKSSLIDIFHFLFGANNDRHSPLAAPELSTDAFSLTFDLYGKQLTVTRSLDAPNRVTLEGDHSHWPVPPDVDEKTGLVTMTIAAWLNLLGQAMFNLPPSDKLETNDYLTFRSCFPYFARRQRSNAYFNWRRHYGQQKPVAWQVSLAFLLGLDREGPVELHRIKEAEKQKGQLEKMLRTGLTASAIPSSAKLQSETRRLKRQLERLELELQGFHVVEYYDDWVKEGNDLQRQIEELTNANTLDDELVRDIEEAMRFEAPPAIPQLAQLYKEAGVILSPTPLRRYEEVRQFHEAVVVNRRQHLQAELQDARARIEARRKQVAAISERRNGVLQVLNSGGALEHFRKLDGQLVELRSRYEFLARQQELAEKISMMRSDLKVQRAEAERMIRQELIERRTIAEDAEGIFETISNQIYEKPSYLDIRAGKDGIDFHVESPEIASDGIARMQIFTFDLTLATVCAKRGSWPGFLIHDSHIFDGVDGRQIASALTVAGRQTAQLGGQYIVTMNSDDLDKAERESGKHFRAAVVQPELDDSPTGCLFGFRFATTGEESEAPSQE